MQNLHAIIGELTDIQQELAECQTEIHTIRDSLYAQTGTATGETDWDCALDLLCVRLDRLEVSIFDLINPIRD